jgi:hypothetical protein
VLVVIVVVMMVLVAAATVVVVVVVVVEWVMLSYNNELAYQFPVSIKLPHILTHDFRCFSHMVQVNI